MTKSLKIYYTSDLHGYILPVDYASGKPAEKGLLKMVSRFKKDGNTLVIDGGDTIQGSPFTMYAHRRETGRHPIAAAMNRAGYDYVTLGNHDFNYGKNYLRHYLETLDAACVCANVKSDLPILPYDIKVMENGLRVGIIGGVTDWVNVWERPENLDNMIISDTFSALKESLKAVKEQVDVTICIYHGGFERDLATGRLLSETTENIGCRIAQELEIDLLLTGHQHIPVAGVAYHGTHVVQPGHNGLHFLEIEGVMTDGKLSFSSQIVSGGGEVDLTGLEPELELEAHVQKWLDAPVGHLDIDLLPEEKALMALHGSPIANFFNQVQFWATGADISETSLGNAVKGFSKDVTVRDVVSTYIYPNTLAVLEITGSELKQVLERPASYLDLDGDGVPQVSSRFLTPKVEHYNYDYFAGVTYEADLRKPAGQRVGQVLVGGQPVVDDQAYTICMNNYRLTGAGGYEVFSRCKLIRESQVEMSELIINYLESHDPVVVEDFPAPKFIY